MSTARINAKNGRLVFVCTGGGKTRTYSAPEKYNVSAGMSESEIREKVKGAIGEMLFAVSRDDDADAIDALRVPAMAKRIYGQLHPQERKATPRKKEEQVPKAVRPPKRERPVVRKRAPPAPTITTNFLMTHVRQTAKGKEDARNAVDTLGMNRDRIQSYVSDRKNDAAIRSMAVELFNELYKTDEFRLFSSYMATQDDMFAKMQMEIKDNALPGNATKTMIRISAKEEVSVADVSLAFTRAFLFEWKAKPDNNRWFLDEVNDLPLIRRQAGNDRKLKGYRFAPFDADTLIAAALYTRRWYLENPASGKGLSQDKIPGWDYSKLTPVQETAQAEEEPKKETPEIEVFSEKKWKRLGSDLFTAIRSGRPERIVEFMTDLPKGHKTLEDALKELKRNDLQEVFDQMFNDYLAKDDAFRGFVSSRKEYKGVVNPAFRLDKNSREKDRELVASSIQAFLNFSASRGDYAWFAKLKKDIADVHKYVLKSPRETVEENGEADLRTMLLVAAYTWRSRNQTASINSWTRKVKIEIKDEAAQPEKREVKRGRVLQFPY